MQPQKCELLFLAYDVATIAFTWTPFFSNVQERSHEQSNACGDWSQPLAGVRFSRYSPLGANRRHFSAKPIDHYITPLMSWRITLGVIGTVVLAMWMVPEILLDLSVTIQRKAADTRFVLWIVVDLTNLSVVWHTIAGDSPNQPC